MLPKPKGRSTSYSMEAICGKIQLWQLFLHRENPLLLSNRFLLLPIQPGERLQSCGLTERFGLALYACCYLFNLVHTTKYLRYLGFWAKNDGNILGVQKNYTGSTSENKEGPQEAPQCRTVLRLPGLSLSLILLDSLFSSHTCQEIFFPQAMTTHVLQYFNSCGWRLVRSIICRDTDAVPPFYSL